MTLPVTNLDTIDFEKLVDDARGLIPRYAPLWTDHNAHDPGITLIELLAWIADQEIYRVGFVGERHLKSFAALLGVRRTEGTARARAGMAAGQARRGPQRGRQEVRAGERNPSNWKGTPGSSIPRSRTFRSRRVSARLHQQDPPVAQRCTAAADRRCTAAADRRCTAAAVHAVAGASRIAVNYLSDRKGGVYVPDVSARRGSATDRTIVRPSDRAACRRRSRQTRGAGHFGQIGDCRSARQGRKELGPDRVRLPGRQRGLAARGRRVGRHARAGAHRRCVSAHPCTARESPSVPSSPSVLRPPRSVLRLRLDRGFFPVAPKLTKLALNVLPIVQLETIEAGMLARSNGLPDQVVSLDIANHPEAGPEVRPLTIFTEEGNTRVEWTPVPDLKRSGPNDSHYVVDKLRNRLRFGNGINGRIPPRHSAIRHDAFHVTHGREGNLGASLKWRLASSLGEFGKNLEPTSGGSDASSVEELIAKARGQAIERKALLTNDDLRDAALNLPGFAVGRADVLVRHDPSVPHQPIRGTRTLIVVPTRDPLTPPSGPVPAQYLDALREALAPRRLLGERLSIEGPSYVRVDIALRILIAPRIRCGRRTRRYRARDQCPAERSSSPRRWHALAARASGHRWRDQGDCRKGEGRLCDPAVQLVALGRRIEGEGNHARAHRDRHRGPCRYQSRTRDQPGDMHVDIPGRPIQLYARRSLANRRIRQFHSRKGR